VDSRPPASPEPQEMCARLPAAPVSRAGQNKLMPKTLTQNDEPLLLTNQQRLSTSMLLDFAAGSVA